MQLNVFFFCSRDHPPCSFSNSAHNIWHCTAFSQSPVSLPPSTPNSCIMAMASALRPKFENKAFSAAICPPFKIDDVGFVFSHVPLQRTPGDAVPNLKHIGPINGLLCLCYTIEPGRWVKRTPASRHPKQGWGQTFDGASWRPSSVSSLWWLGVLIHNK